MRKLLLVPIVIALGCAHKAETKKETTPQQQGSNAGASGSAAQAASEKTCNSDLDCADKQLCVRARCVDISAELAECNQVRVHFPLNSAAMEAVDKAGLERAARCLKGDHALHVTVEGNADERGTEEYNLALGDKRATAVAKYLEALGASDAQLKTVSYGKENPLCTEHDEACWASNRRAEIKTAEVGGKSKKKH